MVLKRWVTIAEGTSPKTARTILASEDPALVRAVAKAVADRLDARMTATSEPDIDAILRDLTDREVDGPS